MGEYQAYWLAGSKGFKHEKITHHIDPPGHTHLWDTFGSFGRDLMSSRPSHPCCNHRDVILLPKWLGPIEARPRLANPQLRARRFKQQMFPTLLQSHQLNGWGVRDSVFRLRLICNLNSIYNHRHQNCKIWSWQSTNRPSHWVPTCWSYWLKQLPCDFVKLIEHEWT